jgi:hypothetical protein
MDLDEQHSRRCIRRLTRLSNPLKSSDFAPTAILTKDMVVKRDITSTAQSGLFVLTANLVANLDIVAAQFDAFMELAKVKSAATPQDPGAHGVQHRGVANGPASCDVI